MRTMKIRRLETTLRQRGYTVRLGKGSHRIWTHPSRPGKQIVLAGSTNADAHHYQIASVYRGQQRYCSASPLCRKPLENKGKV